jgi:hypothetical protein
MNVGKLVVGFFCLLSVPSMAMQQEALAVHAVQSEADTLSEKLESLVLHVLADKREYMEMYRASLKLSQPSSLSDLSEPHVMAFAYIAGPNKGTCGAYLYIKGAGQPFKNPEDCFLKLKALFDGQAVLQGLA